MKGTRVLLFVGVIAVAVATVTISNAAPGGKPDAQTAVDDVRAGKGRVLPMAPGRDVAYSGWWQGCRFVITKSKVTAYEAPNGQRVEMVSQPEPTPPREPDCVDREPTDAEINANRAEVTALNARNRPDGAPEPPTLPPYRSGR